MLSGVVPVFPLLYDGVALNCKAIGLDGEADFAAELRDVVVDIQEGVAYRTGSLLSFRRRADCQAPDGFVSRVRVARGRRHAS